MDREGWHFNVQPHRGARIVNPAEGILFEDLTPLGALIRESAQNSLDAAAGNGPVGMRFSVQEFSKDESARLTKRWFSGLRPHLTAVDDSKDACLDRPLSILVVEDFGTIGLSGDGNETGLRVDDSNRFYWFHRNVARTMVAADRGGSFGYGKSSFTRASKISCFITVSKDSTGSKVFGSSILKVHEINNLRHEPYGDFGRVVEDGGMVLPAENIEILQEACEDFNLERGRGNGLSIIIPHPETKYSAQAILQSVIRNYLHPIANGRLTVEVVDGKKKIEVNSDNLLGIVQRLPWDANIPGACSSLATPTTMRNLTKLAIHNAQALSATAMFELSAPERYAPRWSSVFTEENFELYDRMYDALHGSDGVVSIQIDVNVRPPGERPVRGRFFVYLKRCEEGDTVPSDALWVRRYISVPLPEEAPAEPGFVAITHIPDGPLERMLRLSEEVAHTTHKYKRVQDQGYEHAKSTVEFVRKAARSILSHLTSTPAQLDRDWLDQWFDPEIEAIPDAPVTRRRRLRKPKKPRPDVEHPASGADDEQPEGEFVPPPPPDDLEDTHGWDIYKIKGGCRLEGEISRELTYRFTIQLGYARDSGDAFKNWSAFDFNLASEGPIVYHASVGRVVSAENNILVYEIDGPVEAYALEISGFDTNRDLRVNARPKRIPLPDRTQEVV